MVKITIPPTAAELAAFDADMARLRGTIADTAPEVASAPAAPAPALNPNAPRLHLSEPTMVDPKTEAVWLAVQAITKAREAGMTDDELLESAQMQMHDDEDNTIISRNAPKWAWDVIDEVMGNVAANDVGQAGAACAALLGHGVTREESAAAWEEML